MSIGFFADKAHRPTDAQMRAAIGARLAAWDAIVDFIHTNYAAEEDFAFLYGKNYGWACRFRVKGKLLTALYPTDGGVTAQIILNPAAVTQALRSKLGKNAKQAIGRATPYAEGRWLFIPVESKQDLRDVERLLNLRLEPKK